MSCSALIYRGNYVRRFLAMRSGLLVLGVHPEAEQQAEGVGVVVEHAAVVMGFDRPHVRVQRIDGVPVGFALRPGHQVTDFLRGEVALGAFLEDGG